ncbi:hypothetical protein [Rhodococcus sp. UNC363MFTsu5.1]|uniref:hypothetical protein n=1 Tax=Rhodococcus sp. UNC363MFTsu5.1 TaxID=1449069 RepID=UPI00048624DD|nr:hypothetical protein [Rhodococcus sp. UNC363MFTsu5.1]
MSYKELRDYLAELAGERANEAYEHITKALGWNPPPLWEAPRAKADVINAEVKQLDGFRHVGWYCEHPLLSTPPYGRITHHREWSHKNKRGWRENKNVSRSVTCCPEYDSSLVCPQRQPIYVRISEENQ